MKSYKRNFRVVAAPAAKSLQSCPTLCDPIAGILQARILEWVAISFSKKRKRVPDKYILCFTDYAKAFDCVDHKKLENS